MSVKVHSVNIVAGGWVGCLGKCTLLTLLLGGGVGGLGVRESTLC